MTRRTDLGPDDWGADTEQSISDGTHGCLALVVIALIMLAVVATGGIG